MASYGGIDLGGTKIQAVIVDESNDVLGSSRRPTPTSGGPADVAAEIVRTLRDAAKAAELEGADGKPSLVGIKQDGDGSPTTYAASTLTFDPESRMTAYGSALDNGYTGGGMRAWKQAGSSAPKTYFLYDGDMPVCEMDSTGAISAINTVGDTGLLVSPPLELSGAAAAVLFCRSRLR